uniref:Uncharacterized protein n=1 Tax=Anguilla anguilla TaxID=7936 RepID=A0A0E9TDI7_ANGAN
MVEKEKVVVVQQ